MDLDYSRSCQGKLLKFSWYLSSPAKIFEGYCCEPVRDYALTPNRARFILTFSSFDSDQYD